MRHPPAGARWAATTLANICWPGIGGAGLFLVFTLVRDVAPGEAVYITFAGELHSRHCAGQSKLAPCCLNMYFARPDIDSSTAPAHAARLNTWARSWPRKPAQGIELDVVIPIPDNQPASSALELAGA